MADLLQEYLQYRVDLARERYEAIHDEWRRLDRALHYEIETLDRYLATGEYRG